MPSGRSAAGGISGPVRKTARVKSGRAGYLALMTSSQDPNLDDVLVPRETTHPDHREHAKTGHHIDDDELERRTRLERDEVEEDADGEA